jgi:crossover junction endodeoxyribonuclease RuvC
MLFVIGIDPGVTGAWCALTPATDAAETESYAALFDLPTATVSGAPSVSRRIDGRALRSGIAGAWRECRVVLALDDDEECDLRIACEAVHAREGDRNSMQSQGSLMRSLGAIEAVADTLGAPATLIPPRAWQDWYGLMGKSHQALEKRAALKAGTILRGELPDAVKLAARLFPRLGDQLRLVKDHNRAEAALIARYHLRTLAA